MNTPRLNRNERQQLEDMNYANYALFAPAKSGTADEEHRDALIAAYPDVKARAEQDELLEESQRLRP